jgi:hypothetical protein
LYNGYEDTYLLVQDGNFLLAGLEFVRDLGEAALELIVFASNGAKLVVVFLRVGLGVVAILFARNELELHLFIQLLGFLVLFTDTGDGLLGLTELVTAMLKLAVPVTALPLPLTHAGSQSSDFNPKRLNRLLGLVAFVAVVVALLLDLLNSLAILLDLLEKLLFSGAPRLTLGDNLHPDLLQRRGGAGSTGHELHQGEKFLLGLDGELPGHAGAMAMGELGR